MCDNRGYSSQAWNVYKYFAGGAAVRSNQFFGNVITPTPDYVKLAEAYGATGERVEKTAALEPAIERALAALAAGPFGFARRVRDSVSGQSQSRTRSGGRAAVTVQQARAIKTG